MDVIPVNLTDQNPPVPNIRTRTFFIIKDLVDEQKLRDALDTLIRRDWRRLGARVVRNPHTGYEYHLPKTFDDTNYKLFRWSSSTDQEAALIEKSLPWLRPTDGDVAFLPGMKEVDAMFRPQSWPFDLSDELDAPLLHVHLIYYADATVLSLSMPHIIGDQFGMSNLIKAWMEVAGGGVAPEYVESALPERKLSDYPKEKAYRKGHLRVRKRFEYPLVILGFLPDLILRSKEDNPIVFLPTTVVERIRERCLKELDSKHGNEVKLTHGDIISAILTKFSRGSDKKPRWLSLSQTIQVRNRMPELSGDKFKGFLGNSTIYGTSRFRIGPETPISEIAHQVRRSINETLEPAETDLCLAIMQELARRKQGNHVCEPLELSYHVTSWPGAWKGLDFSNAVKETAEKKAISDKLDGTKTSPALQILGQSGERKTPGRYHATIISKTDEGYWCDFHCNMKTGKIIRDYVAKDPKLESFGISHG